MYHTVELEGVHGECLATTSQFLMAKYAPVSVDRVEFVGGIVKIDIRVHDCRLNAYRVRVLVEDGV